MGAVLLPAIALSAGVAVDYSGIYSAKSNLQQMADAAVLAAAREMVLINKTTDSVEAVAKNFFIANMATKKISFSLGYEITTAVDKVNNNLTVSLSAKRRNAFGNFLQPEYTTITAVAKAKALAGMNICAIGLDTKNKDTLFLKEDAVLVGNNCGIFSNSTHAKGISLKNKANLQANMVCSAGGFVKTGQNPSTIPVTDCPPVDDPLISRAGLSVGGCRYTDYKIDSKVKLLWPGTYCGGLKITGKSVVQFIPGIYVIKDGIFEISGTSVVNSSYAGFYFTGADAKLKITRETRVSFVAPKRGKMAGLLFFQDPNSAEPPADNSGSNVNRFLIQSNNARTLLGTIYLPKGILRIDSENPIAGDSAFTVVIAKRLQFIGNSRLVLNSDYSATDVPVPTGIAGDKAKVYLTQ